MIDRRRGSRSQGRTLTGAVGRQDLPGPTRGPGPTCSPGSLRGPGPARSGDRGSASVLVALWAVVLTTLASGGLVLTSVLAARASVSTAADLAALAGATATLHDPGVACTRAQEVARANRAALLECRVGGTEVWVVVRVPTPAAVDWLLPGRGTHIRARAHAELTAEDP